MSGVSPDMVVLVPVPVVVVPPGERVNVHVPEEGSPLSTTLPVDTKQVGWVMVPTVGADEVGLMVSCLLAAAVLQDPPLVVRVRVTGLADEADAV